MRIWRAIRCGSPRCGFPAALPPTSMECRRPCSVEDASLGCCRTTAPSRSTSSRPCSFPRHRHWILRRMIEASLPGFRGCCSGGYFPFLEGLGANTDFCRSQAQDPSHPLASAPHPGRVAGSIPATAARNPSATPPPRSHATVCDEPFEVEHHHPTRPEAAVARTVVSGRRAGYRPRQGSHLPKLKWPMAPKNCVSQLVRSTLILTGDQMDNHSCSKLRDHAAPSTA